jgi:hypothetical protein
LQLIELLNVLEVKIQQYDCQFSLFLENKKEFIAWVKETNTKIIDYNSLHNFRAYHKEQQYSHLKKFFKEDSPITLSRYIESFSDWITEPYVSFVIYFLNNDIAFLSQLQGYSHNVNSANISIIKKYFTACKELDKKPEKTRDLTREITETIKTALFVKAQKEAVILQQIYSQYKNLLEFENEEYKVIIPSCASDFAKEAMAQNNCVQSYYQRVLKNETLVVFIRKKTALEAPYITCEINPENKKIRLYLLKNNIRPINQDDVAFYYQYQEHLFTQN